MRSDSRPPESDFYEPLIGGARMERWVLFRIADGSWGKKPFDLAGSAPDGLAVGVEVKIVDRLPALDEVFPWGQFSQHQIEWLKIYSDQGSYALMALYDYRRTEMRLYRLLSSEVFNQPVSEFPQTALAKGKFRGFGGWGNLLLPEQDLTKVAV